MLDEDGLLLEPTMTRSTIEKTTIALALLELCLGWPLKIATWHISWLPLHTHIESVLTGTSIFSKVINEL